MLLQIIFIGIAIVALLLLYLGTGRNLKLIILGGIWLIISGALSYYGFFQNTSSLPPRMLWILLPVVILVVSFYRIVDITAIRENYLIAIHILRIPVELVLYQLFLNGKIPIIMTFRGWNFDIVIGISAIVILGCYLLVRKRLNTDVFKVWNILGILFLLMIVSTAILSAPSPIQMFSFENPNLALITFPYTLLPAVIVPIVLLSHLLCLKKLKGQVTL